MKPLYVRGVGLWAPHFPTPQAFFAGERDDEARMPPCNLVGGRLKRGSSRFANMLGEAVEQAAMEAAISPSEVPIVYSSSLGEIETMVTLLRMLFEEEGKLSPNRFKNSVHNAASGLVSIGTQNTQFTTALAGGARSFEIAMLEAWALSQREGCDVIVAVADDTPPEPLQAVGDVEHHGGLAVAIALSPEPADERPRLIELSNALMNPELEERFDPFRSNCSAAAVGLAAAYLERKDGPVGFGPPGKTGLGAELQWPKT